MRPSNRVAIRYLETMPGRRRAVGRSTEIGKEGQQMSWAKAQIRLGKPATMCCHHGDSEESPGSPVDRTLSALTARGLGLVPAQGTKIPKVKAHGQIK